MGAFYNIAPGDVFFTASDIGWAVGHAYIIYAPLLNGSTSILYEVRNRSFDCRGQTLTLGILIKQTNSS